MFDTSISHVWSKLFVFSLWIGLASVKRPCNPDSFQFINIPNLTSQQSSYLYQVSNREEIGCAINASYHWQIFRHEFDQLIPIGFSKITNVPWIEISYMDFGGSLNELYDTNFVLRVSLIPRPTHYRSYRLLSITMPAEKYIFEIEGGTNRTHILGKGVMFLRLRTGRESGRAFDGENIIWSCFPPFQDFIIVQDTLLEVLETHLQPERSYNCKVTAKLPSGRLLQAEQHIVIEIRSTGSESLISMDCLKNCNNSDPLQLTQFVLRCYANCEESPIWSIHPFDATIQSRFILDENKTNLIIPRSTFGYGSTYDIIAAVGDAWSKHTLSFGMPKISLSLQCKENCYLRHKEIVLAVVCVGNCLNVSYTWEIVPKPITWEWERLMYHDVNTITFPAYFFPNETGADILVYALGKNATLSFIVNFYVPFIQFSCSSKGKDCFKEKPHAWNLVELTANCLANCDVPGYYWTLNPPTQNEKTQSTIYTNKSVLSISSNSYLPGQQILIALTTEKFGKAWFASTNYSLLPPIDLKCIRNCGNSTPHRPVVLNLTCEINCDIYYKWYVSPTPDVDSNIQAVQNNTKLYIPSNVYKAGDFVNIAVEGPHDNVMVTINYTTPDTKLAIFCISNCLVPPDPAKDIILRVVCMAFCEDIEYKWDVVSQPYPIYWYDLYSLEFGKRTLIVKKQALEEARNITFTVQAPPGKGNATYSIYTVTSEVLCHLMCRLNCHPSWTHLATDVSVNCLGRADMIFYWRMFLGPNELDMTKYVTFKDSAITIFPFMFTDNQTVNINATAKGETLSINISYQRLSPDLDIKCSPKECEYTQNCLEKVTATAVCLHNCFQNTYSWIIEPDLPPNVWYTKISLTNDNTSIVFLPNAFPQGKTLNLTVIDYKWSVSKNIVFALPKIEFTLLCVENCNPSNPYQLVHIAAVCTRLCHYNEKYQWELTLPVKVKGKDFLQKMSNSYKRQFIKIPEDTYKDGDIVHVKARIFLVTRMITIFYVDPTPLLKIICYLNCAFHDLQEYRPEKPLMFEALCLENCVVKQGYVWAINQSNMITFHNRNKSIRIKGRTFRHNDEVNITVCLGKGCTSFVAKFKVPMQNFSLFCKRNCYEPNIADPFKETEIGSVTAAENLEFFHVDRWHIDSDTVIIHKQTYSSVQFSVGNNIHGKNVTITAFFGPNQVSISILFLQLFPSYRIVCLINCGYPDPTLDVALQIRCFKNCNQFKYYVFISPQPREFIWDDSIIIIGEHTIIIPKYSYQDEEIAMITVNTSMSLLSRFLKFAMPPPKINITCTPNCDNAITTKAVSLVVHCLKNCLNIFYEWDITPKPKNFIWSVHIAILDQNRSLLIKANTYSPDTRIDVSVTSNKSSTAKKIVVFGTRGTILSLKCLENCYDALGKDMNFLLACTGACNNITQKNCKISPPPRDRTFFVLKKMYHENILTLGAYAYDLKTIVNITCSLENATDSLSITYPASINESCFLTPSSGYSTFTEHMVECVGFSPKTYFKIYQRIYEPWFHIDTLLFHSAKGFMTNIYVASSSDTEIIIAAGIGWHSQTVFYKHVLIKNPFSEKGSFAYRQLIEEETNNRKSFYDDKLILNADILHEKYDEILFLMRIGEVQKMVQLAFCFLVNLEPYPNYLFLKYQQRIYNLVKTITHRLEPIQTITFFYNSMYSRTASQPVLLLVVNQVRTAAQRFLISKKFEYNINVSEKVASDIFYIVKHISILSHDLLEKNEALQSAFASKDHLIKFKEDTLIGIASEILKIIDLVTYFVPRNRTPSEEEINEESSILLFHTIIAPSSKKWFHMKMNGNLSSVYVPPKVTRSLAAKKIRMTLAHFNPHLFWYNKTFKNPHTDTVYFSVNDTEELWGPYFVALPLYHNNTKITKTIKLGVDDYCILAITVPPKFTIKATVLGSNVYIQSGLTKLDQSSIKKNGVFLNGTMDISYSERTKNFYLGVSGSGEVVITMKAFNCLTWFVGDKYWSSEECSVPKQESDDFILCKCKKSVLITAFSVPPQSVIFKESHLFHGELITYLTITMYAAFIMLFLLVLLMLAYYMDTKTMRVSDIHFIQDNNENDRELYLLYVQTGFIRHSGTTSRVCIQIIGSKSTSRKHLLNFGYKEGLQRNNVDCFAFCTPALLGQIRFLQIWHDSFGSYPHWYCDTIMLVHVRTAKRYVFVVSRWFSLIHTPFSTEGTYTPLRKRKVIKATAKLNNALRQTHFFFGMFTDQRTPTSCRKNVFITILSTIIIILVSTCLLEIEDNMLFPLWIVSNAVAAAEISAFLLDILLNRSP